MFNTRYVRVGHLFQSRFGSRLVRDEIELARVVDYVLENPVAAGLCDAREHWPWSGSGVLSDALLVSA